MNETKYCGAEQRPSLLLYQKGAQADSSRAEETAGASLQGLHKMAVGPGAYVKERSMAS